MTDFDYSDIIQSRKELIREGRTPNILIANEVAIESLLDDEKIAPSGEVDSDSLTSVAGLNVKKVEIGDDPFAVLIDGDTRMRDGVKQIVPNE